MYNTIFRKIKEHNLPIIICGAGIVGKILLDICRQAGLEVECFADSSKKVSDSKFCGLEVIYTPDLKTKYTDAVFLISTVSIKDVVDLLSDSGFDKWYAAGPLLKNLDYSQDNEDASLIDRNFAIDNCIICHDGFLNPDKLFFRSIDLIITERCSLKCRDCSNLMQYYESPQDCNSDMLLKSIDCFCELVDEIMDFRIIGGEVFMNREWPIIIGRLINEPKTRRVVLYTNATIVPNNKTIELLQNPKIIIIATNYGQSLSRKLDELKKFMTYNHIRHRILIMENWLDCSKIMQHHRSEAENMQLFKECCAKNMPTLSDGKIFRCPYAANAFRLKAVPNLEGDYIDIFQEMQLSKNVSIIKNKIKNYILYKKYLGICDFCNGRPLSGVEVEPAVQTQKPLKYRKYDVACP